MENLSQKRTNIDESLIGTGEQLFVSDVKVIIAQGREKAYKEANRAFVGRQQHIVTDTEDYYKYQQFYKMFPKIVPSLSAQLLSWFHYEKLLQVYDQETRVWYAKEAYEQTCQNTSKEYFKPIRGGFG